MPQVFNDGDTYLHLAVGRWIIDHGAVPVTDPFSATVAGAPFTAHEWLSQVLMALCFKAGGWNGVVLLYGAVTALAFGMLARHLSLWLGPLAVAVTLFLTIGCISSGFLLRPHMLALPLMELWTAGLLLARSRRSAPSLLLLPLMVLWINMHGGFMFGILLIGPFALEALMEAGPHWRTALRGWVVFSVATFLAALINPYGWHVLTFPFQLMHLTQLGNIVEWRSMDFRTLQPTELALVALLYVCLSRGVRLPPVRILLLAGLLHMALKHVRLEMQMGLVGALALAEPLGLALYGQVMAGDRRACRYAWPRLLCFAAAAAACTMLRVAHPLPDRLPDTVTAPATALDHVPENVRAQPVLNEDAFGSYMLYRGLRPFVDGRMDVYGDAFMAQYLDMMSPHRQALEKIIRDYGIKWAIFAAGTPIIPVMDALPGWHRIYTDNVAVVYSSVP